MKRYRVVRYWEVRDEVEVEAENKEEAIEKAHELDFPPRPHYVDESINSDIDVDVQELGVNNG
jgi:hypothetical protein